MLYTNFGCNSIFTFLLFWFFIFAFLIFSIVGFKKWRWIVFIVFALLLIEYPVRMLLPGRPYQILLIKEPLIFILYSSLLIRITKSRINIPISPISLYFLLAFLIIGISETFFTWSSLTQLLIGLRSYIWYLPFLAVGYFYFKDEKELVNTINKVIPVVFLIFGMQVFQFLFWDFNIPLVRPLGSPIHSFTEESVKLIPGPFGTAARCARVLFIFFLVILSLAGRKRTRSLKYFIISALSFVGIYITGIRSTFFLAIFSFFLFCLLTKFISLRNLLYIFIGLYGYKSLMMVILSDYNETVGSFYAQSISLIIYRIKYTMEAAIDTIRKVGFIGGYGLGSCSQGIQYLVRGEPIHVKLGMIGYYENGIWKLVFETGILGATLYFLFLVYLLIFLYKNIKIQPKNSFKRNFSISVFCIYLAFLIHFSLVHHQLFGDSTTLIPLWFLVGIVIRLKDWSREGKASAYPTRNPHL